MESSINSFQDGKVMLTLAEAASYMSLSKSYLYKLVCWGEIAYYKPVASGSIFISMMLWRGFNGIVFRLVMNLNAELSATCPSPKLNDPETT